MQLCAPSLLQQALISFCGDCRQPDLPSSASLRWKVLINSSVVSKALPPFFRVGTRAIMVLILLLCDLLAASISPLTGACLLARVALAKLKPPFWLRKHIDILSQRGSFDASDIASSPDNGDRALWRGTCESDFGPRNRPHFPEEAEDTVGLSGGTLGSSSEMQASRQGCFLL